MKANRTLNYLFLTCLSVLIVLPLVLALSASFKTIAEMYASPLRLLPDQPSLEAWKKLFRDFPVAGWLLNSVYIAVLGTLINIVICSLAGYAFARIPFCGKQVLYRVVISTLMLPLAVYIVPLYILMDKLNLLNTYWSVALPISESIFGVFLLTQFFKNIPLEMEEAALMDGCGPFRAFLHIFLPMAKSSLITLVIFSIVWKWNMFLWALIAINDSNLYTIMIGIALSAGQYETDKNMLMAGAALIALPVIAIYFIFQKFIVESHSTSGLK